MTTKIMRLCDYGRNEVVAINIRSKYTECCKRIHQFASDLTCCYNTVIHVAVRPMDDRWQEQET